MSFSLVYLVNRLLYRIWDFLRSWYWGGLLFFSHQTLKLLELLDRRLALRVTARNLLRPLYQDYTLIGYVLGFIFRVGRIIFASLIYGVIIALALAIYAAWALVPPGIIYYGLQ